MFGTQAVERRVLRTLDEIDAVGPQWRLLERHSADPLAYFQGFDWCRNWVAQFGARRRAHVITFWVGEELLALWPLMVAGSMGFKRLETLGVPHTQYCGLLVHRGSGIERLLPELVQEAVKASGCDVAVFRGVPETSPLAGAVRGMPRVRGPENAASMLDLSAYASAEDYTAQLGKLQKRNRNRRRNHLARLGELRFEVIWPGHPEWDGLVRRCTAMKREWLAETGRFSAGFSHRGYEDFLARLDGDAAALEGACLSVLRVGERVVALELGLLREKHYYAYIGGFDWALRDLSPGKVQMDLTVCWLIDRGVGAYDLLTNPADYKQSWSNKTVGVRAHAQALSWKGRLYAGAWLPRVRPALKEWAGRLPEMAYRASVVARGALVVLLYV